MAGLTAAVVAESANIARHLPLMAARQPDRAAVKIPRGRTRAGGVDYLGLSFSELDREVDAWAGHLQKKGVNPGDRVLVMVRPGLPLIAAVFALFKMGAVPVIIDPGMGRKNFLACVARSSPRVLLGIPRAQILSHLFRLAFRAVKVRVWASSAPTGRLFNAPESPTSRLAPVARAASDLAAILFTSGSTGAPKGVCYEHGMFDAQVRLVRETYGIQPGEIDLPMLPVFALFGPALGLTTIVPELDPSHPAAVDPAKIVRAIQQENVTNSFGSPTLWRKIFDYCLAHGITLPSLRRVLCAGAAVPHQLYLDSQKVLSNGVLHSPYGATEALPISTTSSSEVLARGNLDQAEQCGVFLGTAIAGMEVRIIALSDEPIATLAEARELPRGEIGEIIVRGPVVTKSYDNLPEATRAAKIGDGAAVWHRMGDCGQIDAAGRLWFCGRKAERVDTAAGPLYPELCEQVFRAGLPGLRTALIGLGPKGQMTPALVVECPEPPAAESAVFLQTLQAAANSRPQTAGIKKFFFNPAFPVDVRHNAKIHRLALARWAATAKAYEAPPKP